MNFIVPSFFPIFYVKPTPRFIVQSWMATKGVITTSMCNRTLKCTMAACLFSSITRWKWTDRETQGIISFRPCFGKRVQIMTLTFAWGFLICQRSGDYFALLSVRHLKLLCSLNVYVLTRNQGIYYAGMVLQIGYQTWRTSFLAGNMKLVVQIYSTW